MGRQNTLNGENSDKDVRKNKRKLKLSKNSRLGKNLESVEKFQNSFFRENYYNAFALVEDILKQNEEMIEDCKNDRSRKKRFIEREKLYNIIAFCGDRGTGKTSVMDSVINVLRIGSQNYKNFITFYEREIGRDGESELCTLFDEYEFICLDEIDVSLLEENEDIFDAILSEMYSVLQHSMKKYQKDHLWEIQQRDQYDSYSKRDIQAQFEKIHQNKRNLFSRQEHFFDAGESSIEQLNDFARSLNIRQQLQALVPVYLSMVSSDICKKKYLIVGIDELDMHEKAFEMLEQLHRYFMIPQMIIFMAVSEREIQSICEKHFETIYGKPSELAMSYLEKVLPYSRRVYLPKVFNGDFFDIIPRGEPGLEDSNDAVKVGYPVKNYLLGEIAQKTQVFYDGCGSETHFYEIGNLRALYNLYYLLHGMNKVTPYFLWREVAQDKNTEDNKEIDSSQEGVKEKLEKEVEILDGNFDKLKNDVIGRMAMEKLINDKQYDIFQAYYKEDVSSNGKYIFGEIIRILGEEAKEYRESEYSYGGLLGVMLLFEQNEENAKALIQCVLAITTIELTQNYIYAFFVHDEHSAGKLKEYISGTVGGVTINYIFPAVYRRIPQMLDEQDISAADAVPIAYVKNHRLGRLICGMIGQKTGVNDNQEIEKEGIAKRIVEDTDIVETIELLMMFVSWKRQLAEGELTEIFSIKKNEDGDLTVYFSTGEYDLDVLGFVVKSMEYEVFFDETDQMLLKMLKPYCSHVWNKEQEDNLIQKIQKRSMRKEYSKWDQKYHRMSLPVYSPDIMYNMMKRIKMQMRGEFPQKIGSESFLVVIKEFYNMIAKYLGEENRFYEDAWRDNDMKDERTWFQEAFCQTPFIKFFLELEDTKQLPQLFVDLFKKFISELVENK